MLSHGSSEAKMLVQVCLLWQQKPEMLIKFLVNFEFILHSGHSTIIIVYHLHGWGVFSWCSRALMRKSMLPRYASGDHPRARDALQGACNVKAMPYGGIVSYASVWDIVMWGPTGLCISLRVPFQLNFCPSCHSSLGLFSATSPTPIFKPKPEKRSQGKIFGMGKPHDTSHH